MTSPIHDYSSLGFGTRAIHVGSEVDQHLGAVVPPIALSSTYGYTDLTKTIGGYVYSRDDNPNRNAFERAVASLENAKFAVAFASGTAAISNVIQMLKAGTHVVSTTDIYGGTHTYFTTVANNHGVEVSFTPKIVEELESLIRPETKLVWIETPSNPTLSLVDISAVAKIAHAHNISVVVDNTFMSPYLQNPLGLGADIVLHSATKYINGHSDVVMGVVAVNDSEIYKRLSFLQVTAGAIPSPFDSWLAQRGLKTLHLRVRAACSNALAIAKTLEQSPHVIAVNYPGIDSHPDRELAIKQHRDGLGGGMISFRITGGIPGAEKFCQSVRVFTLAQSLGGVESLCQVPSVMTHAAIPREQREAVGVFDDLVRLSIGVEDEKDLVEDILQALEAAAEV